MATVYVGDETLVASRQSLLASIIFEVNRHLRANYAMRILVNLALLMALQWCGLHLSRSLAADRPNIIFLLVDDAGFGDFPNYRDTHQRTPNIDRLTSEGLRFTQFYVNSPICSPSRAAFTTGQFPARVGITSYISANRDNYRRGMRDWLALDVPTIPTALHRAGYATGHFGKWHLGGGRDVGNAPLITDYGFDESLTQFEGLGDRVLPLMNAYDGKTPIRNGLCTASEKLGRGNITWLDRDKVTDAFIDRAIEFIEENKATGKPFYVNVWPDDVHTPLFPPAALRDDGTKRQLYLGVLENMDAAFGRLFDFIRSDLKLSKNTLIIVSSDNGPEPGAGVAGELTGHKTELYEGGIREPLIMWGPDLLAASSIGSTNDESYFSAVDMAASLLAIAEAKLPADAGVDGEQLGATLLGHESSNRQAPLYWVRPPDRPGEAGRDLPDLAVRDGKWKLLTNFDGTNTELYDLESDEGEQDNRVANEPAIAESLKRQLLAWYETIPKFGADAK